MAAVLVFENVSYAYNDAEGRAEEPALKNISLEVEQGEFVAVLGHNGSGKSTLAKLINGLFTPTEGKVHVCGMDTGDENSSFLIRQSAGMVFQNPDNQLVATIVEEDVAFGLENLGLAPAEIRRRVDEALLMVGMSAHVQSAPHMLSGGQKQRVAIAGVIAMKPKILVLDEPTAMLDPLGREEVIATAMRLREELGLTLVCITHFMEEAAKAQRVIVMHEGKIEMEGTPREVFARTRELQALGLGAPAPTMLARRLIDRGTGMRRDILTAKEFAEEICRLL